MTEPHTEVSDLNVQPASVDEEEVADMIDAGYRIDDDPDQDPIEDHPGHLMSNEEEVR